jgi:hypothetical protein
MGTSEFANDPLVAYREDRWQRPRVADLAIDQVTLRGGTDSGCPRTPTEHLTPASTLDAEEPVQLALRFGDGDCPGSRRSKNIGPCSAVPWYTNATCGGSGVGGEGGSEPADQFSTKQSTEVAQEHEERGSVTARRVGDTERSVLDSTMPNPVIVARRLDRCRSFPEI